MLSVLNSRFVFTAFKAVLFKSIEEIKLDIRESRAGIEALLCQGGTASNIPDPSTIPLTPASTVEELYELEDWLSRFFENRTSLVSKN